MLSSSQHFGGRRACWSSGMGTRKIDKQLNYSHEPTQTKQQIGQCITGALLVHGQATNSQDSPQPKLGGSHHLPPYNILCAWPWYQYPNVIMSQDSQMGVLKFPKLGLPRLWKSITFVCKPPIEMRSKAKLQPSSRDFQRYVAHHLQVRKLGRFLTFSGRESNSQFDSRPFFWP